MTQHFIDVGADTGQTFDYLSKYPEYDGCTVWCLEPSPRSLSALLERANAFASRYHINLCTFGLRGKNECLPFFLNAPTEGSFDRNVCAGPVAIWAFSKDVVDFITGISDPYDRVVLKLDCEGSEYDILKRLWESPLLIRVQKLMVEFHPVGPNSEALKKELEASYASVARPLEPWTL